VKWISKGRGTLLDDFVSTIDKGNSVNGYPLSEVLINLNTLYLSKGEAELTVITLYLYKKAGLVANVL
jgi:hypothetical protein